MALRSDPNGAMMGAHNASQRIVNPGGLPNVEGER